MSLFNWSDKFSINIQEMDQQHKKLVDIINLFYDAKQANKDQEILGKVLDDLLDYTKMHFKKEEELMEQCGYPDYIYHKAEHNNLVQKVLGMQKKFQSGNTEITTDIAILLNDWLAEHILVEDKKYSPHFLASLLAQ